MANADPSNFPLVEAKILQSQGRAGAKTAWHSVIVDMTLEIDPQDGETYTAKVCWLVKVWAVQHLQVDNLISIHVDPNDPNMVYPEGRGFSLWDGE